MVSSRKAGGRFDSNIDKGNDNPPFKAWCVGEALCKAKPMITLGTNSRVGPKELDYWRVKSHTLES